MNFDLHLVQQALLLLACLLGAWAPVALLRRRFAAAEESVWLGRRVIDGVLFPMLALLLTWVALRGMLHAGLGVQLLRMALPILSSLLLIRLVVRVLRLALPQSGWAHAAERWVSWLAWGGSILWISGLWPAAWAELEAIEWKLGGVHISLATLLEAAFNVVLVLVVTLWLSAAIESRLLQRATDDLSARKILNKEPKDGWNQPFIFKCPGDHGNEIDLTSKGKDRKDPGKDGGHFANSGLMAAGTSFGHAPDLTSRTKCPLFLNLLNESCPEAGISSESGAVVRLVQVACQLIAPMDQKRVSPELSFVPSLSVTNQPVPVASTAKPSTFSKT